MTMPQPLLSRSPSGIDPVIIVGGGPVGLACALELAHNGIASVVLERRPEVSMRRPRAKTTSARTMEHFRRWGLADELRDRAPLKPSWSQEVVFCTTVLGREVSRIGDCFGLELEGGELVAECGQQVAQPIVEQLLRDAVGKSEFAQLVTSVTVTDVVEHADDVEVSIEDESGAASPLRTAYVLGCDGGNSLTRAAIGIRLEGGDGALPNLSVIFRAPELRSRIPHGPALHYWVLNPEQPGIVGWLDLDGTFWGGGLGVDAATTTQTPEEIVHNLLGEPMEIEVLATDAWRARLLLADSYGTRRVFLVGDAAHQNPPWGGHGFNTGIGDAVNVCWKLAAVLNGWAPESLLSTYEIERRPVEARTITESARNMSVLSSELGDPRLFGDDTAFHEVAERVAEVIQQNKPAEFHSLGLTLGYDYEGSPAIESEPGYTPAPNSLVYEPTARPGHRLPHFWFEPGDSLFDHVGRGLTLVGDCSGPDAAAFVTAAEHRGIPLVTVDLGAGGRPDLYGALLVLVRPDQHVVWRGDSGENAAALLEVAIGARAEIPVRNEKGHER
jgi:2-polyprenyl-6-methoxyphenol hydroxylase-like FAD-dependent oxidoreductase